MATLLLVKTDFKTEKGHKNKEYYIKIKDLIEQKYVRIGNIYTPNNSVPKYMKTKLK